MFEYLSDFQSILVSGPQRSGTRIAGKMIAHDLGCEFVGEEAYYVDSLSAFVLTAGQRAREGVKAVYQAPGLSRWIHIIGTADLTAVVFMARDIEDILASQERVNWQFEGVELAKYDAFMDLEAGITAASVKYEFWRTYQRERIPQAFEVSYGSLSEHELWIPKEERQDFEFNQTERST